MNNRKQSLRLLGESVEGSKEYTVFGWNKPDDIETFQYTEPKEAIKKWVELQDTHSLNVSISSDWEDGIKQFYDWINNNETEYQNIIMGQDIYTWDNMKKAIGYNYSKLDEDDSLEPFSMG